MRVTLSCVCAPPVRTAPSVGGDDLARQRSAPGRGPGRRPAWPPPAGRSSSATPAPAYGELDIVALDGAHARLRRGQGRPRGLRLRPRAPGPRGRPPQAAPHPPPRHRLDGRAPRRCPATPRSASTPSASPSTAPGAPRGRAHPLRILTGFLCPSSRRTIGHPAFVVAGSTMSGTNSSAGSTGPMLSAHEEQSLSARRPGDSRTRLPGCRDCSRLVGRGARFRRAGADRPRPSGPAELRRGLADRGRCRSRPRWPSRREVSQAVMLRVEDVASLCERVREHGRDDPSKSPATSRMASASAPSSIVRATAGP